MSSRSFARASLWSGALISTTVGLMALLISGCDEIDQMADNASKRPPVQSLTPPQIDTDLEAREHPAP